MKNEKPRSRLGRGLSSLLSVGSEPERPALPVMLEVSDAGQPTNSPPAESAPDVESAHSGNFVLELDPSDVSPNPHQPRRQMNEASIAELAASLKTNGIIQPIIVRRLPGGAYQLIAGERRWRAAKLAGLTRIPAIARDTDSATQAQLALVENIQREDLNPIDRAESYRALMDQLGLTQAEIATRLGEDRSGIANYLRLLNLTEPVREHVREGRISFGHAKLLAGVDDILEQQRLADLVVSTGLSVRKLEEALQTPKPKASPAAEPTAHYRDLEQSISRQLGMRVQLRSTGKKGRLIIHYSSLDEFDQLLARMGAQAEP